MSSAEILKTIRTMSAGERREIVGKIWAEFGDADFELTPVQAAELDRRLLDHAARPDDVVPWDEIKSATEAKYGGKR